MLLQTFVSAHIVSTKGVAVGANPLVGGGPSVGGRELAVESTVGLDTATGGWVNVAMVRGFTDRVGVASGEGPQATDAITRTDRMTGIRAFMAGSLPVVLTRAARYRRTCKASICGLWADPRLCGIGLSSPTMLSSKRFVYFLFMRESAESWEHNLAGTCCQVRVIILRPL
jgi:hypothetical protein